MWFSLAKKIKEIRRQGMQFCFVTSFLELFANNALN